MNLKELMTVLRAQDNPFPRTSEAGEAWESLMNYDCAFLIYSLEHLLREFDEGYPFDDYDAEWVRTAMATLDMLHAEPRRGSNHPPYRTIGG